MYLSRGQREQSEHDHMRIKAHSFLNLVELFNIKTVIIIIIIIVKAVFSRSDA